jgi:endonuclease YncB( thermonuclease family)
MIKQLALSLILFSNISIAEPIKARVVKVYDGDTITFIENTEVSELNKKRNVEPVKFRGRLYGIDAPELRQEFGTNSREILASVILNREVTIENVETDKTGNKFDIFGRRVIKVYIDDLYVNEELVKYGYAWSYKKYNNNDQAIEDAEKYARTNRLGLWNTTDPINPEDWRKLKKANLDPDSLDAPCDFRLTCKSIRSCDEAKFLLETCKFSYLDSDSNGIPCETLCK